MRVYVTSNPSRRLSVSKSAPSMVMQTAVNPQIHDPSANSDCNLQRAGAFVFVQSIWAFGDKIIRP